MPERAITNHNVRSSSHSVPAKSTLRLYKLEVDSVFPVKDNQPLLWADLHTYFADPLAHSVQASTIDRRSGRIGVRRIKAGSEMTVYLSDT